MNADLQQYILMIEDDADDRYITETVFMENGYVIKLEFLVNGDEVIDLLETRPDKNLPSLIIIDKNLPKASGLEVLSALKMHDRYKYIPVVIISGSANEKEIAECYLLGANSFIQKPLTNVMTSERISGFVHYWFGIVALPHTKSHTDPLVIGI